ncbi:MAG: type 1 glutamine amidotransferase [Chlorobi bacterium]|nr:type 1 glutamine amidotransferase [Chlorobiota bacterium]
MGKRILIVKNIAREGPGLLEPVLERHCVAYTVCDISRGETIPDPLACDALVILGGPQSADDDTPAMRMELDMAGRALQAGMPCLGICLGLQVMVKAVGGLVMASPVREIGFFDPEGRPFCMELTGEGKKDPLFRNMPESFRVFQLHGETVDITESMRVLGVGRHCRNQAVRVGPKAYGLQCHFELTAEMLREWSRLDPDLQKIGSKTLMEQFETVREDYTATGISLMTNFLKIAAMA